jgi:hypothetical protein
MQKLLCFILISISLSAAGQSRSVDKFRKAFQEDNNVFIYSSTLKMLNTEENPEFADLVKDIEEIRVLNYDKSKQQYTDEDITNLKNGIKAEHYNDLMMLTEKDNRIYLYGREKNGKTVGLVALVDNSGKFMIIDVAGAIDFNKFMQLKNKLDTKL